MARTDTLSNYLTDVSLAIKNKKGDQTPIKASDFDIEIENLPSGGDKPKAQVDVEELKKLGWTDDDIAWLQENIEDSPEFTEWYKFNNLDKQNGYNSRFFKKTLVSSNFYNYKLAFAILSSQIKSPITTGQNLFNNCNRLQFFQEINLSSVTSMRQGFYNCFSLKKLPSLNISNVTDAYEMFYSCSELLKITGLDTQKIENAGEMFRGCSRLRTIESTGFNNLTKCNYMFYGCQDLRNIPSIINTSRCTDLTYMFQNCYMLETIPELDAGNVISIQNMFTSCYSLINFGGLKDIGKSYVTTMSAGYAGYIVNLSDSTYLTNESAINVLSKVYDIKSLGCNAQKIRFATNVLNNIKATENGLAAISSAEAKGWTVTS